MGASGADALVLDANSRAALVAVRSLGRAGLRVAVAECASRLPAPAMSSRWAASRHRLPDVWRDPDGYVDAVLEVVAGTGAAVVLPAHDGSVSALRSRRADLAGRTVLALPDEQALAALTDKAATLALARTHGVRVPRGVLVTAPEGIPSAAAQVGLPAVVKPTESWPQGAPAGADRLVCTDVADEHELRARVLDMLAVGTAVLVQELVPGRREAVHVIADRGRVAASSAQATLRTYPPLGGSSVLRCSIPLPDDTLAVAQALIGATGLSGYAEVEFRRDAQGAPVLMEVNARLSASVEVAVLAGLDVPLLVWRTALGLPLQVDEEQSAEVRMRWLGGDVRWLVRTVRERGRPQRPAPASAAATFAGEFLRRSAYDYLGWRDPRPVAVALGGFVREGALRGSAKGRSTTGRSAEAAPGAPALGEQPALGG